MIHFAYLIQAEVYMKDHTKYLRIDINIYIILILYYINRQ